MVKLTKDGKTWPCQRPSIQRKMSRAIKAAFARDPPLKLALSRGLKRRWKTRKFRRLRSKAARKTARRLWKLPSYRRKQYLSRKRAARRPSERKRKRLASRRVWRRPGYRKKMSKAISKGQKGCTRPWMQGDKHPMHRPSVAAKVSRAMKGRRITWAKKIRRAFRLNGSGKKIARKARIRWRTPGFAERVVPKLMKAYQTKPNGGERKLQWLLEQILPGEYRYNDGWFILERKVPDFVNVNGRKKLIEVLGHYHTPQEMGARVRQFKCRGYDTLLVWYDQLRDVDFLAGRIWEWHSRVEL